MRNKVLGDVCRNGHEVVKMRQDMKVKVVLPVIVAIVLIASVVLSCLPVSSSDAETSAVVLNTAPTVAVGLTPDVQVINSNPTTTNKTVTITASVTDMNGYDDLTGVVIATITGPSVVEDSPVSLSFDSVVDVTTARYKGSFNMSSHSEGEYKVEVTATDNGGLNGVGSKNFTYSYEILHAYAIWANSTTQNQVIRWAGSGNVVNGNVHSNKDIRVSGSDNMVTGTTEYVSTFTDSGSNNTFIPIQISPEPFPLQYNITDYIPNGSEAIAAGDKYHHIEGRFQISDSDVVLDGLYYVKGDVKFSGRNLSGVFTIVAEEKIDISASKHNCTAYSNNLLFLSCEEKIKIAVSDSNFCGVIYAEKGQIEISHTKNTINGGLFADTIKLPASDLNINAGQTTGGCNILESCVQTSERYIIREAGVDKWAFGKQHFGKPPADYDDPNNEFKAKEYAKIKVDDGTMQIDASAANGFYAIHRFNFSIAEPESSITKLDILWDGKATHDWGTDGATLYIWNFSAGKYEQLDTSTDVYITLGGTITDNIGDYIDDDSMIIIAEQNSAQWEWWRWRFRSRLGTDYVRVNVFEVVIE